MADDKKKEEKKEDPRVAAARKRAADLAKAAGNPGTRTQQSGGQFFKEVWNELRKTTWPDRDTLVKSTYVVLAFIAAAGMWVFVLSYILDKITAPLFGK